MIRNEMKSNKFYGPFQVFDGIIEFVEVASVIHHFHDNIDEAIWHAKRNSVHLCAATIAAICKNEAD